MVVGTIMAEVVADTMMVLDGRVVVGAGGVYVLSTVYGTVE